MKKSPVMRPTGANGAPLTPHDRHDQGAGMSGADGHGVDHRRRPPRGSRLRRAGLARVQPLEQRPEGDQPKLTLLDPLQARRQDPFRSVHDGFGASDPIGNGFCR